jgi:monothiol glutaredoxin
MQDVQAKIAADVKKHKILLYVKGDRAMPQCGFSKAVMDVFDDLGVDYETRNVLEDPEIRDGIKMYTQWPTIPQIFINGEFVGGCDIVRDLHQSGELAEMVKAK